jgi:hypothetical protein
VITIKHRSQIAFNRLSRWTCRMRLSSPQQNPVCTFHKTKGFASSPPMFSPTRSPCHLLKLSSFYEFFFLTANCRGNHIFDGSALSVNSHLKNVNCRSWGGDRIVMLPIYRALIRSDMDYGSFVYGSSTKPSMPLPNPVHNTDILIITGSFRTTPLDRLL